MLGWALFIAGSSICLLNFYLSLLRYPLHRAMGRSRDGYQWVSGVPLLGSLVVILAWAPWTRHHASPVLDVTTWSLALLDTGGIHWFVATMMYKSLIGRGKPSV